MNIYKVEKTFSLENQHRREISPHLASVWLQYGKEWLEESRRVQHMVSAYVQETAISRTAVFEISDRDTALLMRLSL